MTDSQDSSVPVVVRLVRLLAVASGVALVVVLLAVAVVAMAAEFSADWNQYFLMQRAMALGTPVALGLLGTFFTGMFATVYFAPKA